jgi:cobalt-precorrin 5A hydrolase
MIVAGVGFRRGAAAAAIAAVIEAAFARAGLPTTTLELIAAPDIKAGEGGLTETASALGVPLVLVPQSELETAGRRAVTRSLRILKLMGVPSAAEAAALAAAGPAARLIVPRIALGPATCALVRRIDVTVRS